MVKIDNQTKVALALSSGGAKGYAHIGVIKAIEETGAQITSIAGCSMGAMVGGLYAAGKLDEAYRWLSSIDDAREVFSLADLRNIRLNGLMNGESIIEELRQIVGDIRIEDLRIPFCAIATDLDMGTEVVIDKGPLLDAIRASISMPAIFRPFTPNGSTVRYMDGGLVNGLPINRLKRQPGDIVVAINLDTYGVQKKTEETENKEKASKPAKAVARRTPGSRMSLGELIRAKSPMLLASFKNTMSQENMIDILLNSFYISLKQNKIAMVERTRPDIYLNIDLQGYKTQNFSDAEEIAKLGYEQMRKMLTTQ